MIVQSGRRFRRWYWCTPIAEGHAFTVAGAKRKRANERALESE